MAGEKKVEDYLKMRIEALGGWCVKFPPLFFAGFPDRIILMMGGRIYFVETKAGGKHADKLQNLVHRGLRRLGFRVDVIDTREKVDAYILTI